MSEADRGQSHAINKGFAGATGDLFGWLNSDDQLEPGALQIVAEHALRSRDAEAFVGYGQIIDLTGKVVYYKRPGALTFEEFCRWCAGGDFMQPSCFFRRSAWEVTGPVDQSVRIALDVDLASLSMSLTHDRAKSWSAHRDEMVIDTAIVVIRAGARSSYGLSW